MLGWAFLFWSTNEMPHQVSGLWTSSNFQHCYEKKKVSFYSICFLLPMLLEQSSFMPLFILSLLPRLPLFCQASPSFPSLSITLICNIPVLMGVGKMLCRRGNLLKTSPNGQVHLKSLINNFNYKILVLLQGLMCHCHRTVFFRKGHLFSKHFPGFFPH